jgi:hypothetical protein
LARCQLRLVGGTQTQVLGSGCASGAAWQLLLG